MRPSPNLSREEQQTAQLRQYRLIATGLLIACAGLFAATTAIEAPGFWVRLLQAGAEAAIVGGLADWFAVTALFRRPLGLPIPHTAIVPRQKDRVGEWLGTFVVDNFLATHAIAKEIKAIDLIGHAARWLSDRSNAERAAERMMDVLPSILSAVDDRDMRRLVAQVFGSHLSSLDLAAILGTMLRALVTRGHHKALLQRSLPVLQSLIADNAEAIDDAVERRLWFLPKKVDRYLARRLVVILQEAASDLSRPDHPTATRLEAALLRLAHDLEADESLRARINAVMRRAINLPEVQAWMSSLWDDVRRALLDDIASPAPALRRAVADRLVAFGTTLETDPAIAGKLTAMIDAAISTEHVPWRARIARFIADEVRAWNTAEFTRRMELWAGTELQYVRINGTVLGFLIGVGLFLATEFAF
ncbi:MAG TPA: DUF445 domain-containing protein [Alphaproteobacteria bacterium]